MGLRFFNTGSTNPHLGHSAVTSSTTSVFPGLLVTTLDTHVYSGTSWQHGWQKSWTTGQIFVSNQRHCLRQRSAAFQERRQRWKVLTHSSGRSLSATAAECRSDRMNIGTGALRLEMLVNLTPVWRLTMSNFLTPCQELVGLREMLVSKALKQGRLRTRGRGRFQYNIYIMFIQ